ncbi:MAG TPA: PQQ-dependent sugar dehydrogenase [Bryobacteraceae bacterium]|jgi:glucose/arabinose dehydrogenase|nr:PQQ-dependent sugar dehydrogenase [Bryobacteraceae bacterium]
MRTLSFLFLAVVACAQPRTYPLGPGPWTYTTYEKNQKIRVSVVTKGLSHPWSLAFLPNGDVLITERPGRVRLMHNGVLAPEPVADLSKLSVDVLFDVALHPDFAKNGFVYLTYIKKGKAPDGKNGYWATTALARGKFDDKSLTGVQDVFVADAWQPLNGGDGSRVVFGPDGKMYLSSSHRRNPDAPQDLNSDVGKILRLNDDGTIPKDNPFVGKPGAKPEIYSWGHRTVLGLTFKPGTNELWETENGPQGGDEVNVIKAGKNYGWPLVTYGRDYDGKRLPGPSRDGFEPPELFWVPSVTASGILFYSGDKIPAWKGNLFLGSMTVGRLPGTGNLQRIVFNENGEQRRESLLTDLHQRIRDVRQGPDGLLYLLTDENDGAVLKIEPAQ